MMIIIVFIDFQFSENKEVLEEEGEESVNEVPAEEN